MNITITTMSPRKAAGLLRSNTGNRKLDGSRVRRYANEMTAGQWKLTGDPVKVAPNGRLIDGQHRLEAVVASGVTVKMAVATDVPEDVFDVIDSGKNRTMGDVLRMAGIRQGSISAAVARTLIVLAAGMEPTNEAHKLVSRTDILDFVAAHEESMAAAVQRGNSLYNRVGGNWAAWSVFCHRTAEVDPEGLAEFADAVLSGAGLAEGDPRLALRNFLAVRRPGERVESAATYQRVYNAWAQNRRMKTVRAVSDPSFPAPVARVRRRHERAA
jgi:hypothetical protein